MAGIGGRPIGSKSKRTLMREAAIQGAHILSDIDSLDALNEALAFFMTQAREVKINPKDPETSINRKGEHYLNAAQVARHITPYRHPALASIHTTASKTNVLERQGVTELEVAEQVAHELIEKMIQVGRMPRKALKLVGSSSSANGNAGNGAGLGKGARIVDDNKDGT